MNETWMEHRKQTALMEYEIARLELEARQAMTWNPMERSLLSGLLELIGQEIRALSSYGNAGQPWVAGFLGSIENPLTNSEYRDVCRVLRQYHIAEIESTPLEVIGQLRQWSGDEDVGVFTLRAGYHAEALAGLVDREYVNDLLEIVRDIVDTRKDPLAFPADSELGRRWGRLGNAIATATNAYDMLEWEGDKAAAGTGIPSPSQFHQAAEQAALARRYLWEAQEALESKRSGARNERWPERQEAAEWSFIGRDMYHNRIRKENFLGKGQFVVIDVKSGDFEVGDSEHEAWTRLRERRPDARTWVEKVGFPTPYRMDLRMTDNM